MLELAAASTIQRVGAERTKTGDVEVIGAAADLFVRREPDPDDAVRDLGMLQQVLDRRHDLGDAGLVVRAEQGRAGRRDDVVADACSKCRIINRAQHHRRIVWQHEVAAVVLAVNDRPHAGAAHLGRRVHVRNEPDYRHARFRRGSRNRRHHVTMVIEDDVIETQFAQLGDEQTHHLQLPWRGRRDAPTHHPRACRS